MSILKKPLFLFLLVLSYVLLSYNFLDGWWNSSGGTVLILIFSYLIWGNDFLKNIGLSLKLKMIGKYFVFAILILIVALYIMEYIATKNHVKIESNSFQDYYHSFFYTLNEEIVVGAILLFLLVDKLRISPFVASVGLAIFFVWIHIIFYKWIFNDKGQFEIITLITLFLVDFIRNSLICLTGHIGYSWALHFGWVAVMLSSVHINTDTGLRLTELERFNMYLGPVEVLLLVIVPAVWCTAYWMSKQKSLHY